MPYCTRASHPTTIHNQKWDRQLNKTLWCVFFLPGKYPLPPPQFCLLLGGWGCTSDRHTLYRGNCHSDSPRPQQSTYDNALSEYSCLKHNQPSSNKTGGYVMWGEKALNMSVPCSIIVIRHSSIPRHHNHPSPLSHSGRVLLELDRWHGLPQLLLLTSKKANINGGLPLSTTSYIVYGSTDNMFWDGLPHGSLAGGRSDNNGPKWRQPVMLLGRRWDWNVWIWICVIRSSEVKWLWLSA